MIFLTHPFAVILLLLTAGSVFSIIRSRMRRNRLVRNKPE
jgi:hypothetical protein